MVSISALTEYLSVNSSENAFMLAFMLGTSALDQNHIFLLTGLWYLTLTSESMYTISWSLIPGSDLQVRMREGILVRKISNKLSLVGNQQFDQGPNSLRLEEKIH